MGAVTVTYLAGGTGPPRVAYTVGRRVGGAVVRNQLRRRLRAIVTERASALEPGAYLIGAAPRAATVPFDQLREDVIRALARLAAPAARAEPPR